MDKVLVVCAHPDDEVLGVGGTIARHVDSGDIVQCIILGEGATSRSPKREFADLKDVERLKGDTLEASKIIGYEQVHTFDLPDNRFDSIDLIDIVKSIENIVKELQPGIIYTHHHGDLNVDHRITAKAVITATRPVVNCSVKEIYGFETLSSTEWNFLATEAFTPNLYVNIYDTFQRKIKAMRCYASELADYPHPRSVRGMEILANFRGLTVGYEYAEAFRLIRKII